MPLRPAHPRPSLVSFALILAVLLALPAASAGASTAEDTARGFSPKQAYQDGLNESVNLYNLNPVLSLPLSPTYTVADKLSYGMTAYYNAGVRWGHTATYSSFGRSLGDPDMNGWLGMGWRLDFGKVRNSITLSGGVCVGVAGAYVDAGGSFHVFNTTDIGHTIDGSGTQILQTADLGPPNHCRVPTRLQNNAEQWYKTVDPNTAQVTRIEDFTGANQVNVGYMTATDFLNLDANAPSSAYFFGPPSWPEIKEQTLAIKNVTDTRGRTISTTMTEMQSGGFRKFLLTDIAAPVFGNAPGSPTGHWTLHYEIRPTFSVPDPNWPALDPNTPAGPFPLLTQIELPADASGNRLTYTFDYNAAGELSEIRTPSGGRTVYEWGDEYISPDPEVDTPSSLPLQRVIVRKLVYPSFYDAPGTVYVWRYSHNRYPKRCDSSHDVYDKWRAIVTDPESNDTEYRFFTTKDWPFADRPNWYPRAGYPGAVKVYKGQARRWLNGAMWPWDVDPNFPGSGVLKRGTYYRYRYHDPNSGDWIHQLGTETIYYDDRLDSAFLPLDPNATDPACIANIEMDFLIGSTSMEGWAWQAQVHDPNNWILFPVEGGREYKTTEMGNLVGSKQIQVLGEGPDLCPVRPVLGVEYRSISEGGVLKELSQSGISTKCIRRSDVLRSYGVGDRDILYSRDIKLLTTWTSGLLTSIEHSGGDPVSFDPNATGDSGITYTETLGHTSGVVSSRQFSGVSWLSEDSTVDAATGLAATRRDPAAIATTFTYDALGRTLSVNPASTEIPTVATYPVETHTFTGTGGQSNTHKFSKSVEVSRGNFYGSSSGIYSKYDYDGLGRLTRETRGHANGTLLERTYTYDGLNAPTFTSEWHAAGATGPPGTTISYRDGDANFPPLGRREPFGRPLRITDPSGNARTFSYSGLNDSVTVEHINGSPTLTATTATYRDFRGNARIVQAPDGAHALYDFDYAGRLKQVNLVASFTPAAYDDPDPNKPDLRGDRFAIVVPTGAFVQKRTFLRDSLGLLRQSIEPEKGPTLNFAYDPLGNPTVTKNNAGIFTSFHYDPAGRVYQTDVNGFRQESFVYANGSSFVGTPALSKLIGVLNFNQYGDIVTHKRQLNYNGLNGRISEEKERYNAFWSGTPPWLSTNYIYDNFGLPSRLMYPIPVGSPRAPMTIAYAHNHGFLTEVASNKATNDPNVFTPLVNVSYGSSGVPQSLTFSNGVVETMALDAASRPLSQTVSGSGTFWNSGTYAYDGAGNIIGIGSQTYSYDKIGRLLSSTTASMDSTPVLRSQSYAYDIYGSMISRGGATGNQAFAVDANTNRLVTINGQIQVGYNPAGSVYADGMYNYDHDYRERLTQVRPQSYPQVLESYAYDDRGWRIRKTDNIEARTTAYVRGPDGLVLSEYAKPSGTSLEPHWKKDYVYALGRHIAAIENTEPVEPAGVTSSASQAGTSPSVSLSWLPVAAADIYGYYVYRSASDPNGSYTRLMTAPTTATSFFDQGVAAGTPYYYKLTSVDIAANESRETAPRKITPGDATPPAAPSNLTGVVLSGVEPVLTWQEPGNAAGDLAGYKIYRGVSGGALTLLWGERFPLAARTTMTRRRSSTRRTSMRSARSTLRATRRAPTHR